MDNYLGHKSITDLIDSVINGKDRTSNNHVSENINSTVESETKIENIQEKKYCK